MDPHPTTPNRAPRSILIAVSPNTQHHNLLAFITAHLITSTDSLYLLHSFMFPKLTPQSQTAISSLNRDDAAESADVLLSATSFINSVVPCTIVQTISARGDPKLEIVRIAHHLNVDLIVVGSYATSTDLKNWTPFWIASVCDWVVRHASCSVLVVR